MKRDLDIVRDILLQTEEKGKPHGWIELSIPGRSSEELTYHVQMMAEQGLIEAQNLSTMDGILWLPKRLTWQGSDFLDAARSDKVWGMAKDKVISTTGTLTIEAMKLALGQVMKSLLTS